MLNNVTVFFQGINYPSSMIGRTLDSSNCFYQGQPADCNYLLVAYKFILHDLCKPSTPNFVASSGNCHTGRLEACVGYVCILMWVTFARKIIAVTPWILVRSGVTVNLSWNIEFREIYSLCGLGSVRSTTFKWLYETNWHNLLRYYTGSISVRIQQCLYNLSFHHGAECLGLHDHQFSGWTYIEPLSVTTVDTLWSSSEVHDQAAYGHLN